MLLFKLTCKFSRSDVAGSALSNLSDDISQRDINLKKGILCLFCQREGKVMSIIFPFTQPVLPGVPQRPAVNSRDAGAVSSKKADMLLPSEVRIIEEGKMPGCLSQPCAGNTI